MRLLSLNIVLIYLRASCLKFQFSQSWRCWRSRDERNECLHRHFLRGANDSVVWCCLGWGRWRQRPARPHPDDADEQPRRHHLRIFEGCIYLYLSVVCHPRDKLMNFSMILLINRSETFQNMSAEICKMSTESSKNIFSLQLLLSQSISVYTLKSISNIRWISAIHGFSCNFHRQRFWRNPVESGKQSANVEIRQHERIIKERESDKNENTVADFWRYHYNNCVKLGKCLTNSLYQEFIC